MSCPGGRVLVIIDGIPAKRIGSPAGRVRIYLLVGMGWSWGRSAYAGNAGDQVAKETYQAYHRRRRAHWQQAMAGVDGTLQCRTGFGGS